MPQYETTLSQDIKDANLEHLLGTGKGSIDISGYIPEIYDSEQSMRQAIEVISRFIHQKDIGKSSPEFITALRQKTQPLELITALEKTNVTSALHAMLEFGTNKQKEYLVQRLHTYSSLIREGTPQARAVESIFMGEGTVQPESVLVGIWREIVHACMLDTPELQALEIARKLTNRLNNAKRRAAIHISRDDFEKHYHHSYLSYDGVDSTNPTDLVPKKEPEITPLSNNLPTFHGSMSRMYPKMEQRKGEVVEANANVATSLIDTYQRIFNKINKKYPNLQEFQKQRHAVFELARVIAKSTELVEPFRTSGSSKRCSFAEQLAWARLDTQVQAQLRGILQKIDGSYLGGIDRFIGKSGNNPYESMFRKITKFKSSVDKEEITATEDFAKRYRQYFIDTYAERFEAEEDKLVSALPSAKFESLDAIEAMDDNEVTELFAEELEYISRKRNRRASLAQKAIDLRFKDDVYRIDWINQAPFGLIKRTHRMFAVGVSKDAALAYAVTEYCFPNHSTDRELIEVCSKLSSDQVRVTRKLSNLLIRLNVEATPNEVIAIAQASEDEDLVKIEQLLTIGFTIADLLKYPWLQKLEVNEAESFPAKGQENSKQRWVADHSYAYLNGGWNKNTLGKIILTRLDARIERSIHDASQWLESFQIPEFSYDIKAIKENLPGNVPPPPLKLEMANLKVGGKRFGFTMRVKSIYFWQLFFRAPRS